MDVTRSDIHNYVFIKPTNGKPARFKFIVPCFVRRELLEGVGYKRLKDYNKDLGKVSY